MVLLGTKYNTVTHRREVVGAGFTTALTDTADYTPFEIAYSPISEINPAYPYVEADSIVILLLSSANPYPQQGSALYLDNLQLWAQQPTIPEDTCSAAFNLHLIEVDTMAATIGWSFEGEPDHFEAEYGVQGFSQGTGTTVGVTESFLHISDLLPDTHYDVYVRCVCDTDLFGEWAMMSFHTDTLVPPAPPIDPVDSTGIQTFTNDRLLVYPNPAQGQCTVRFDREIPSMMRLFSIDGALLQEIKPETENFELTLPGRGVFLIVCEMKEGSVTRRIVSR